MVRTYPYLLLPSLWSTRNRARRRGRLRRAVPGIVLADRPPRRLRRARRLPAAHGALVAVPHVSLVPRLQRRRHGAVDVFSRRRFAPAARGADCDTPSLSRALSAHAGAVVVDGGDLSGAGARGYR